LAGKCFDWIQVFPARPTPNPKGQEMNLDQRHFAKLVDCYRAIEATPDLPKSVWSSPSSKAWLSSVEKIAKIDNVANMVLSDVPYDRHQLREKIHQSKAQASPEIVKELVVDILAWGGLGTKNGQRALRSWDDWIAPCVILANCMATLEAYDQFYHLKKRKALKGIAPAYYTKLIYFLGEGDGLIMDQWTARSINLLFGKMIKMNGGTKKVKTMTVAPQNDSVTYQNYLERVQALSDHLSSAVGKAVSPHETEELIFSFSGTPSKKGRLNEAQHSAVSAWRRYLIEQDRP
jgi:hypothetical protein